MVEETLQILKATEATWALLEQAGLAGLFLAAGSAFSFPRGTGWLPARPVGRHEAPDEILDSGQGVIVNAEYLTDDEIEARFGIQQSGIPAIQVLRIRRSLYATHLTWTHFGRYHEFDSVWVLSPLVELGLSETS